MHLLKTVVIIMLLLGLALLFAIVGSWLMMFGLLD